MILVTTVWHSGTHSLIETLPEHERRLQAGEIIQCHCNADAFRHADNAEKIMTTYRNPYRVAASWVNRGRLPRLGFQIERTWNELWSNWALLVPLSTVISVNDLPARLNGHEDQNGLHAMLAAGDLDTFFEVVPREVVEFALEAVDRVRAYLPEDLDTN